jgi:adenylylsulfate kinase-like enzyme
MKPTVFWITGLPGAGKTTLASTLVEFLRGKQIAVLWLDGDKLRSVLDEMDSFKVSDRLRLAHTYRRLAMMSIEQGLTVVVSTVALFREVHAANRRSFKSYFEIYLEYEVDWPESDMRSHLRSLAREVNPFSTYEPPLSPDIVLSASTLSRDEWPLELIGFVEDNLL